MKISIKKEHVTAILEDTGALSDYFNENDISAGSRWSYMFDTLSVPLPIAEALLTYLKTKDYYKIEAEELAEEIISMTKKLKNKARSLLDLSVKLKRIFEVKLGERFWMYQLEKNIHVPRLVTNVKYTPKDSYNEYANLTIELRINRNNTTKTETINIDTSIMRECKKDPYVVLEHVGLLFETDEMYAKYRFDEKDYLDKAEWQNLQVKSNGEKYICDNVFHRDSNSSGFHKKMISNFDGTCSLLEVPNDTTIYLYNLKNHEFVWMKSQKFELYKYDKNIGKKLILPDEHKNLINILLSDSITELGSDIIDGKGNGTLILTKGKAGLGKTATAEIFSENKECALLSIHSGQLGISGDSIEKKLNEIFIKAERWGCILLIDEADVYIRRRGDDVNHNAIVATFLRTMEYYNGILFMTTNRTKDVDEAIESRCIAVLKYDLPTGDMSRQLWELFINQYNLDVEQKELKIICKKMDKLAGRDIKNICMLVSRYSQGMKIKSPDFEIFKLCATFRGKYGIGGEH